MTAGGLAPPDPLQGPPNRQNNAYATNTEKTLDKAEKEDSGRGLEWFFIEPEVGYQWLGMETFKSDGLTYAKQVSTRDEGLMLGGTAGIRLLILTLGGRARVGMFKDWNVATLNAEVGLHFPLGSVEPYLSFGAGYAFLGAMDATNWGGDVNIRGWDARVGFGLDYYVTPVFTIGAHVSGEALFLSRPGVDLSASGQVGGSTGGTSADQLDDASKKIAAADGSGIGAAATGSLLLGLHF